MDHLLQLVNGGGCLSKEAKGRLVAMAAERLSDMDGGVAAKWLRLLCLLARESPHTQQVGLLQIAVLRVEELSMGCGRVEGWILVLHI